MKLVIESARTALAQPVSSIVTALIVAGVVAAILSTTGQTVQAERQVLSQIDAAGTRSIVISDTKGTAGISPDAVDRISRLSGVQWVIGLGPATDVRPAANPGGDPAAMRALYGTIPPQLDIPSGIPPAGQAVIGPDAQTTLGLLLPVGGTITNDSSVAVVGGFKATDPLTFLNRGLLTGPGPSDTQLRAIYILVTAPDEVASVADAAYLVLAPSDLSSVGIQTSETLAQVRAAVQGELGRYGRNLVTLVLAAGLVLTGLNVYGTVTTRRRDFGRRRALGATRPTIIGLIATQTALTALVGALTGTVATWLILTRATGTPPDPTFTLAIDILAVVTTTIAAIPPATIAAYRDPVRILRVP